MHSFNSQKYKSKILRCLSLSTHGTTPTPPFPTYSHPGWKLVRRLNYYPGGIMNWRFARKAICTFQKRKLNAFEYYWMMFTIYPAFRTLIYFCLVDEMNGGIQHKVICMYSEQKSLVNEENWIRVRPSSSNSVMQRHYNHDSGHKILGYQHPTITKNYKEKFIKYLLDTWKRKQSVRDPQDPNGQPG